MEASGAQNPAVLPSALSPIKFSCNARLDKAHLPGLFESFPRLSIPPQHPPLSASATISIRHYQHPPLEVQRSST